MLISTKSHDEVDDSLINNLIEQHLIICQHRDCQDCIWSYGRRELGIRYFDDKLQKVQFYNVIKHVLMKRDESHQPTELLKNSDVWDLTRVCHQWHLFENVFEIFVFCQLVSLCLWICHIAKDLKGIVPIDLVLACHQELEDSLVKHGIHSIFTVFHSVSSHLWHVLDSKLLVFLERRIKELL